ncbi:acyl-CoA/acyl-ACP dehydrogenase [Couchioplanes caeruleus]|uniref:acyl-CoA dehydrogenase family protein n=1 Tax=Couchioplanes caeruleus TaxID=56438 RepID=UPI0020BF514E|nr:acyl-CoA dehydrogenase family protein [Couchioplanes caeruleus]UQU66748.1 acyl-CoA/acyl-ACP dehydrogenase [Couchioplanes caeruleus]
MSTPAADAQALPKPRLSHLLDVTAALAAHAETHDRTAELPVDGLAVVHEAGLLTLTVGTGYGGPGGTLADTVRTLTALGQGDPSVALISAMTLFAHAAQARTHGWPAELYAEVLAESAQRPTLINALRVEPDLGTPARGGLPATTARRTAQGWELTGHKIFSTGAAGLRWMQVWARTDEDPVRTGAFLVRTDTPGIEIERTWDHLGLRASRSDDVTFDRVPVAAGAVLGLGGQGGAFSPFAGGGEVVGRGDLRAWNALGIAAIYLGVAYAARDWLAGYLQERVPTNLGRPLASLPRFQSEVGAIQASLVSAGTLLTATAESEDPTHANLAKTVVTNAAIDAVQRAVALIGNAGLTRRNPLERHLRDVLCGRIHTPQDDVVLGAAGRDLLEGTAR